MKDIKENIRVYGPYYFCALLVIGTAALCTWLVSEAFDRSVTEKVEQVVEYVPLTEWEILEMAIVKTESDYNTLAVGKTQDIGAFQLTPIFVKDVNRLLEEERYTISDAFSVVKSLEMFNTVQEHYNPSKDVDEAIKKHNPGGNSIGYSKRVYENIAWVKRMEEIRKQIISYESKRSK